jgi:hypothetical protein
MSPSISETDRVFLSAAGTWDRNHDGIVTCDEWKAYAGELFDAADANHDGFVDRTEYVTIINTDRMFQTVNKANTCRLDSNQVAGARAHTEQVYDSKKPESGDPREHPVPGVK